MEFMIDIQNIFIHDDDDNLFLFLSFFVCFFSINTNFQPIEYKIELNMANHHYERVVWIGKCSLSMNQNHHMLLNIDIKYILIGNYSYYPSYTHMYTNIS